MAAELHVTPSRATDADGLNLSGAKWFFYQTGTTTPQSVFTTSALSVAHTNPVVADSGGKFAPIYFNAALAYRGILKTADEATVIYDIDPINTDIISQLAADGGAGLIGTSPGDSVQEVLTAYDGRLDAIETITPTGEDAAIPLANAIRTIAPQGRCRVNYGGVTEAQIFVPEFIVMGGFRIFGNYQKGRAPMFASGVNGSTTVSFINDLAFETTAETHNWYGIFAKANDGDATVTYELVPFLRVGSVAGSVCTLNYAGEGANAHAVTAATYTFTTNDMAGVECLVISEGDAFSGRRTTITANTTTTVTLATIGSVAAFDWLLPSPRDCDHYAYLGAVYWESEPRNIADTGTVVKAYMINTADPDWPAAAGVASPGVKISFGGYISPLATSVLVANVEALSTATVSGQSATYFSHDGSNHVVAQHFVTKSDAATVVSVGNLEIPFSIGQHCYVYTAGSLETTRSGCTLEIKGWIEP